MTSLRDDVAAMLDPLPWSDNWSNMPKLRQERKDASLAEADAIIQTITTRLTSEEAVEAFHATFERFGQLGALKCQRISDDHARAVIQAAIGRATHEQ